MPAAQLGINLNALNTNLQVAGRTPFLRNGGQIGINAGRDLRGAVLGASQGDVTQWWWRSGAQAGVPVAWWSRYDRFSQGIATFGGGNITLNAGRDAIQVHAAAASNGWRGTANSPGGGMQPYIEGGGSVALQAGRDVLAGRLFASQGQLDVSSGRRIGSDGAIDTAPADARLQLLYGSTQVRVQAASDIDMAAVRSAALATPFTDSNSLGRLVLGGLDRNASLAVLSASGDVRLSSEAGRRLAGTDVLDLLLPGSLQIVATDGSIQITQPLAQSPTANARTVLLAQQNLSLDSMSVGAQGQALEPGAYPRTTYVDSLKVDTAYMGYRAPSRAPDVPGQAAPPLPPAVPDTSDRSPVRLIAVQGDVVLTGNANSARPLDIEAGRDISLSGNTNSIRVQHQDRRLDGATPVAVSELSLLKAGRDINGLSMDIAGPGDLVLLAGRDVVLDAGNKSGVVASGGVNNSTQLPNQGANITVVAGLRGDGADYRNATLQGFQLLGVSGWQSHLGALYQAVGGTGDPAAIAAPSVTARLDAVRALLGDAAYQGGIGNYVRALPARADAGDQALRISALLGKPVGDPAVAAYAKAVGKTTLPAWSALSVAQAAQAFAALPEGQQAGAVTALLLQRLAALPAASRQQLLLSVADAKQLDALGEYVRRVTGQTQLSDADALARFDSLPLERQAPWLNRQLMGELRSAGRAAAALEGDARWIAYVNGYLAVDTVFPLAGLAERPAGDVLLPASQLKTVQQADISILAPGGGTNAGEVVAGGQSRSPSQLGIVTVNGGDISALVRDDFAVNQSRVFTLGRGDLLLFSEAGSIDAGRGAKTVVGAPAPVLRLDDQGRLVFDTSGSFSGSGIAVLNAQSDLDLYAPTGDINAGEAGIRSKGNAFLAAERVVNAIDIQVGGKTTGGGKLEAPQAVISAPPNTTLAPTTPGTDSAGNEEDEKKKRRRRRNLLLEFLGFGSQ